MQWIERIIAEVGLNPTSRFLNDLSLTSFISSKSSLLFFPDSNANFEGPWPKTPQSLRKIQLYTPNTTEIIKLCLIEFLLDCVNMITVCTQLFKNYSLWSLELFNGKLGLTYHEVIRGRPLFRLPPHTEKKKKKIKSSLWSSHYSNCVCRPARDVFCCNFSFQLHNFH